MLAGVNHDVIVIGGSAGAIEVLLGLVGELPADLPASIFVAIHTRPDRASSLPEILTRRGWLPASHPLHNEPIAPRRIYVAPPDNHLLVRKGSMEVVRGPRENGQRPAVDPLFRSASAAYGARVIGVVLSGYLDCGTAGMMSIKARGGLCVVQAPASAQVADMPSSVIERVAVDHVAAPDELAALLATLAATPAAVEASPNKFVEQLEGTEPGLAAELVCPICQGVLTEAAPGLFEHFRCHVGHTFSLAGLVDQQSEEMERALWAAVRALEEGSALSGRLAARAHGELAGRFSEKAGTQRQQAELIRQILLHGGTLHRTDATKV
jgi:two-component system chemotaxis response regulator CheB